MSTRGCWGFRIDGQDKLTYNHSDSYPEWLGNHLIKELRLSDKFEIREMVEKLRVVDHDSAPSKKDIEKLSCYHNGHVSTGKKTEWYSLLRHTQGSLKKTLTAGVIIDSKEFIKDSLFCEWAYIINLDDNVFEIYKGAQTQKHDSGRYANCQSTKDYYACALVRKYTLNDLPENISFLEGE